MAEVRTRIAPSPTGNLHVGTARAALFNELFARGQNGKFVLRIEDTDKERSKKEFEENIIDGFKWLGISWDEEIVRQSERVEAHRQAIQKLLDEDKAYQLEGESAIKLKVGGEPVTFTDLIRGEVTVDPETWGGDFVIARSIDDPVFHLAVVVDDADMKISHVIRGEDHVSNTGRHILLQRALGLPTPEYAHLPLLLDETRKKLSKRSGETSLLVFRDKGYLPEAMVNYLALLGWNPGGDEEFFTHEELREKFSLERVQKGGAIFSEEKLQAVNKHYLKQLSPKELLEKAKPFLDFKVSEKAIATEQERIAKLEDLPEALKFFRPDWESNYDPSILVWKKSDKETAKSLLEKCQDFIEKLVEEDFVAETLEEKLIGWIDTEDLGRGDTLWPLRVALTGREKSPSPFEVAAALEKPETLNRIKKAIKLLN